MKPFFIRFKIKAPSGLRCYGHYPYKITFALQKQKVEDRDHSFQFDSIDDPPPVYLLVFSDQFSSFTDITTSDTSKLKDQDIKSSG